MDDLARDHSRDVEEVSEELLFTVSKLERALNFYTGAPKPDGLEDRKFDEERIYELLEDAQQSYEHSMRVNQSALAYKDFFENKELERNLNIWENNKRRGQEVIGTDVSLEPLFDAQRYYESVIELLYDKEGLQPEEDFFEQGRDLPEVEDTEVLEEGQRYIEA